MIPPQGAPTASRRRLWLFRLIAISFPLVILGLVEISLRIIPGLSEDRDPFVNISPVSAFSRSWVAGQEYYSITHRQILGAGSTRILVKKPANTLRIFCLGSSACAGWPHPHQETFSAYLQQALEIAYPEQKIEVVSAAGHGFAAYRTRRVLDEVVQMEPDAILVWEGNNEFLEDRNYDPPGTVLVELSRHLRTVQWLRMALCQRTELKGDECKDVAKFFWKKTRQQSLRLREDPAQFAQVQVHFEESFAHMVRSAQRQRVPIVLCTVPVNLRDWLPTVSCNRLNGEALQRWQELYREGRRGLIERRFDDGIRTLRKALALESEHGESYFWLGRLLEAKGEKTAAMASFSRARDLDYNPFRALSSFNETIRRLAGENLGQGVFLLDLESLFSGASRNAAPGFDLFLDYVHATKPGNLLVAHEAYDLFTRGGVLPSRSVPFTYRDRPSGPNGQPYTDEIDFDLRETVLNMLTENRQFEAAVIQTELLLKQVSGRPLSGPDDPAWSRCPPELAERYRVFQAYLDVQQRQILGQPVSDNEEQFATQQLETYYEKWYPLGRF